MRLNKDDRRRINRFLEMYHKRYLESAINDKENPSNQKYYLGLYVGVCNILRMLGVELTPFSNVKPTQILEGDKNNG